MMAREASAWWTERSRGWVDGWMAGGWKEVERKVWEVGRTMAFD